MTEDEVWKRAYQITLEVHKLAEEKDKLRKAVNGLKPEQLGMAVRQRPDQNHLHSFLNSFAPMSTPDYIDRYNAHIDAQIKRLKKELHSLTK